MSEDYDEWISVYIGKSDKEWFREWETYYATESRSATVKRHMQWGKDLDKLFDEFGVTFSDDFDADFRIRMRSCLEKLAEESD